MTPEQRHAATREQIDSLEQQLHAAHMQATVTEAAIAALRATLPPDDPSLQVPGP